MYKGSGPQSSNHQRDHRIGERRGTEAVTLEAGERTPREERFPCSGMGEFLSCVSTYSLQFLKEVILNEAWSNFGNINYK